MKKYKTTIEIDDALEATAATIIDIDTVAVLDSGLYEVYIHLPDSDMWILRMTTLDIKSLGG